MAHSVQRVVERCQEAQENERGVFDLSNCQLIQVPDAIYFMMRNTNLTSVNLSFNVISKIPPKFPNTFTNITELNLSNNRMSNLPEEIGNMKDLERIDISFNSFISLPGVLWNVQKLKEIIAKKNFIADVDVEKIEETEALEHLNLEENPLSRPCMELLAKPMGNIEIKFDVRELEEWEDLSI